MNTDKGILIYTTKTCAPCKTLLYWLDKKGYRYTLLDADVEPYRTEQLEIANGLRVLPTTLVNGTAVVGLNIPKVAELLENFPVNEPVDITPKAEKEVF